MLEPESRRQARCGPDLHLAEFSPLDVIIQERNISSQRSRPAHVAGRMIFNHAAVNPAEIVRVARIANHRVHHQFSRRRIVRSRK